MWRIALTIVPLAVALVAGPAHAIRLLAWGDSLTAGGDWIGPLDSLGYDWTWVEQGMAGESSWQAADGVVSGPLDTRRFRNWLESGYTPQADDAFVLFWGTNDVRRIDWAGDGVPDGQFAHADTRAALEQMVDDVLALSAPVVLVVPPPFAAGSRHSQAEVDLFNANIETFLQPMVWDIVADRRAGGGRIAAADVFAHWPSLPGWPSTDYYDRGDGVHPGFEPGPSGRSGRFHVAEVIAPAVVEARAVPEPGTLLLVAAGLAGMAAARRQAPKARRRK